MQAEGKAWPEVRSGIYRSPNGRYLATHVVKAGIESWAYPAWELRRVGPGLTLRERQGSLALCQARAAELEAQA